MNSSKTCRVCGNKISPFMSFGKMPIANGFLNEIDFKNEYFFEMKPSFCENCFAFQLIDQPDAPMMFNENYPFFSNHFLLFSLLVCCCLAVVQPHHKRPFCQFMRRWIFNPCAWMRARWKLLKIGICRWNRLISSIRCRQTCPACWWIGHHVF